MIDDKSGLELIERFNQLDKGDKVRFKRSCGKMLNEVDAETLMLFYKIAAGKLLPCEENRVFLSVCIHSLADCPVEERSSFDKAIMQYEKSEAQNATASFNARVIKMLDSEWDDSGFLAEKITRMAKMLRQKGYYLDGVNLMQDLLNWNDRSRKVQKNWARTLSSN